MSSGIDVRRRPDIWSYFSFSSPPRRRTSSVSLPKPYHSNYDPFEKPDRHTSGSPTASGLMNDARRARMNQGQRARYLKAGGLIALVVLLFFFLAPGERAKVGQYVEDHAPSTFRGGDVASDPSVSTPKCHKSHSSSKPLIQYALMIDAGSTGSRIHVYRFNNCGPTPELESEIFHQTAKKEGGSGLSSYDTDADGAARSLDPLLDIAMKNVQDKLKRCTPIAVKATAGLRKLGPEKSDAILAAVRQRLETAYPFPVLSAEKGGVEVMDGKDEGVYAWITTNYLLGKIGGPDKTPTAAVFDLGGGSTQIVFEPTFPHSKAGGMPETLADGDHKYALQFGGRAFTLYQHSYLGYGLMEARKNLHRLVLGAAYAEHGPSPSFLASPVLNPCLIPGTSREVELDLNESLSWASAAAAAAGGKLRVNMTGPATGSPAQCRALAERTLKKEAECRIAPCAFNGVHQPSLARTFAREDVYLFSYFYDRTAPLGMPESFTLSELKDLAARVCQGEGAWDVFHNVPHEEGEESAVQELRERPEHCLDLNFMLALLHTGYEMPIDREVRIAKKIKGNELGWCLGASLPLLSQESGWQCKVREVTK